MSSANMTGSTAIIIIIVLFCPQLASAHNTHYNIRIKAWTQPMWVHILTQPFASCVTLGTLLILSVPQLPPLQQEADQSSYAVGACYEN